jgi:hypothetical protein
MYLVVSVHAKASASVALSTTHSVVSVALATVATSKVGAELAPLLFK